MKLIVSPDEPVLSWSDCQLADPSGYVPDPRFDRVEECPKLVLRVGQTVGEAVRLLECSCEFCGIIRSDAALEESNK
jgi:hypothetical protein